MNKDKKNKEANGLKKSQKNKKTKSRAVARTNVPAAIGMTARTVSWPKETFSISRREFVGTVSNGATTGFALTPLSAATPGYDFNPACANLFPWLSQIGAAFERFRFTKLKFDFIPSQSTSTAGRFYAAVDYDYDDAVATTKVQMMGNKTAVECAIWEPVAITCDAAELNRDQPYRYTSLTNRSNFVEPRTSYSGYLMCAFDTTVANCLYDLWAEYSITFTAPSMDNGVTQYVPVSTAAMANTTVAAGTTYAGQFLIGIPAPGTGPISYVTQSALPQLRLPLGGVLLDVYRALDVSQCKGQGKFSFFCDNTVAGYAPSGTLGTNGLDVSMGVFESVGTYLGLTSAPAVEALKDSGCQVSTDLGVAGATTRFLQTFMVNKLAALYPAARYLAPFFQSATALGASVSGAGFKYEL
jgi:hypothetical protein